MKKIPIYILILTFGMLFYSCEKDLLNKTPMDQISDPDFWKSASDLELYLNKLYDTFDGWPVSGGGAAPTKDNGTDIALHTANAYWGTFTPRMDGTITIPASGGGWNWGNIRNVNYFLANADRVEEGDMKDHYIGEGYFFRAWFYYGLFRDFGDLPIIKKPVTTDDVDILYGARNSRTDVADFIINDLNSAIAKMKYGSELQYEGTRLSKDIALLFKSRVCLYEGTWEKYHSGTVFAGKTDGTDYLQQAASAAKTVIDDAHYSLVTGDTSSVYFNLFNQVDYSGNPEVLFYKHYDRGKYGTDFSNQMWNWPNGYGWTREGLESFLCTDGLPISVSPEFQGDSTLQIIQKNRDPRLAQTVMVPGDPQVIDGADTTFFTLPKLYDSGTGYESQKFRSIVVDPARGYENYDVNYIFFRFAEALLNYAEARAELGTLTQADADLTINQLRDRVGMPHLVLASITPDPNWPDYGYSLPDYLYEVRRERKVELFCEGFRWDDLARWRAHKLFYGKRFTGTYYTAALRESEPNMDFNAEGYLDPFKQILNGPNGGYGFNAGRDYLLPIPSNELTLNDNLTQNPGW